MILQEFIDEHAKRCAETKLKTIHGVWSDEPDRVEFKHMGLNCLLSRNSVMLNWCAYVGVPPHHKISGKAYDDINVDVHGGLTYSSECKENICHKPDGDDEPDHLFWVGFDCAHSGDLVPTWSAMGIPDLGGGSNYRNLDYVMKETKSLAEQLAKM